MNAQPKARRIMDVRRMLGPSDTMASLAQDRMSESGGCAALGRNDGAAQDTKRRTKQKGEIIIPGRYPLTPRSRLLVNDEGKFSNAQENEAALEEVGLVTSAVWSDVDNDGWIDLLVAQEWSPFKYFRNDKGKLVDQTAEAGVADDFDGDSHVELYAVQNFYSPQAETGRMDGGVSVLLKGNGDGTFDVMPPKPKRAVCR